MRRPGIWLAFLIQTAALTQFNKTLASVCRSSSFMNLTAAAAEINKEAGAETTEVFGGFRLNMGGAPAPLRRVDNLSPSERRRRLKLYKIRLFKKKFYSYSYTGVRLYDIKGTPVVYLEMWKVASETINNHFIYHANNKTLIEWNYRKYLEQMRNYSYVNMSNYLNALDARYGGARPKIFTFVRNPISRFVSALGESYFRRWVPRQNISRLTSWELLDYSVDTTKARWLLDAVITGDVEVITEHFDHIDHFFPMSNRLREFLPDYVGRLETMAADWKLLQPLLGIDIPDPSASTRNHASSQDPFSLVRSVKQVLKEDPRYLRSLCALLWRDFVCFSLPFPAECQDMAPQYN